MPARWKTTTTATTSSRRVSTVPEIGKFLPFCLRQMSHSTSCGKQIDMSVLFVYIVCMYVCEVNLYMYVMYVYVYVCVNLLFFYLLNRSYDAPSGCDPDLLAAFQAVKEVLPHKDSLHTYICYNVSICCSRIIFT